MKKIMISDITLRESFLSPSLSLSFKEKLELLKELDRLGVDILETVPINGDTANALLVRTMASLAENCIISCPVGMDIESVSEAWNSLSHAQRPRLHVSLPVSPAQIEYICHKKPAQMLELTDTLVSACAAICKDVEFSVEDATRAEPDFLYSVISRAIQSGATCITVCDTAGTMMPNEFRKFICDIYNAVPSLNTIELAVQCSNELGVSTACAFASLEAGVTTIKCSVYGEMFSSLASVAHIIRSRGDSLGISCNLDMTVLNRTLKNIGRFITGQASKNSPFDNRVSENDESFGSLEASADISAVSAAISQQGYELSDDDIAKVYESFKRIAAHKTVTARDLDAIVASSAMQVPPAYKLAKYIISTSNIMTSTANIELEKNNGILSGISAGDGPIDAAFLAIEQIIGHHYELDDFQIQAVTEGREAMGSALVKLRTNQKLYSGRGLSTDIIGASIRAYIDALNKIVYEENLK